MPVFCSVPFCYWSRNRALLNKPKGKTIDFQILSHRFLPVSLLFLLTFFSSFLFTEKAIDLAFVIGASGPKARSNFARMVTILKDIVDEYEVSASMTRLALVDYNGFSANARVFFSDSYSKVNFKNAAENIPGPGSRPGTLSDALKKVRDEVFTLQRGERPFAEDILVVMTQGDFDENSKDIMDEVAKLRDKPVKIIVIAITDEPDEDKLKVVASGNNLVVIPKPGGDKEEAKKVPFIAAKGGLII